MESYHKILKRQLRKRLVDGRLPESELHAFLSDVDEVYQQADRDLKLLEHSIDLSSRELMEANQQMNAIMRSMPDIYFRLDRQGCILDVNLSNAKDLLLPAGQLIGKIFHRLPDPLAAAKLADALKKACETGLPSSSEYTLEINKTTAYFEARFVPVLADQFTVIVRNITEQVTASKSIQNMLSLLQATYEATNNGFLVVNEAGQIVSHNQRFVEQWKIDTRLLESGRDDLVIASVLEQLVDPEAFLAKVRELYATPMAESRDQLEFKDGRVYDRYSKPQIINGRSIGRVWSFNDITQLKLAETSERSQRSFLENLINNTPNLIYLLDKQGQVLLANKAFTEFLDMPLAGILGNRICRLTRDKADSEQCTAVMAHFAENPAGILRQEELKLHRGSGSERWYQTVHTYLPGNMQIPDSVLVVSADITDLKNAEESKTQLLSEVESINEELRQFAYIISHDLKAPLRAIDSLATWLLEDYGPKFDDQGRELMQMLSSRVMRMHDLIEGVLTYSRLGHQREARVAVDIGKTMADIIINLDPPQHIRISYPDTLPTLVVEPTRIYQVFQNLISNAIKYNDKEQGTIEVDFTELEEHWQFAIKDNGPGIDEKHFQKIFQIFQTLHGRDEYESTGLGLTVVKKIVEMYNGKIWLESEAGVGTTFFFTITKTSAENDKAGDDAEFITSTGQEACL